MNISGSILVEVDDKRFTSSMDFFTSLEKIGWYFHLDDEITYLLNNENGLYNFIHSSKDEWESIRSILVNDLNIGKGVYISMRYGNNSFGWIVQIYPNFEKIFFAVEQYRKVIDDLGVTDFSLHLSYIVPGLMASGLSLRRVTCEQGFW